MTEPEEVHVRHVIARVNHVKGRLRAKALALGIVCAALASTGCASAPYSEEQAQTDRQLSETVRAALLSEPRAYLVHVDVTVYRSVAVLGGLVFDPDSRSAAVQAASQVPGVQSVTDFIQVSGNAR